MLEPGVEKKLCSPVLSGGLCLEGLRPEEIFLENFFLWKFQFSKWYFINSLTISYDLFRSYASPFQSTHVSSPQPPFYLPNSEFSSFVLPQNSLVCPASLGSVIFPGECHSIRRPVISKTDFPSPNARILLSGHRSKKAFNDLQLCYPTPHQTSLF